MSEIDIFVPRDKEEVYLKKHGLGRVSLPNGAEIVFGTRSVADAAYVNLELQFPRGSVYDPPDQCGMTHLFEHVAAYTPLKASQMTDVYFNAVTRLDTMSLLLRGIGNPRFRDFGVWPVLPFMLKAISVAPEVDERDLRQEQGIILEEMHGDLGDSNKLANYFFMYVIYGAKNPVNRGRSEEIQVRNITPKDLRTYSAKFLDPQGLIAQLLVEGPRKITDILVAKLTENLSQMPAVDKPLEGFDKSLFDSLNPDTRPGQTHSHNSEIKNGLATVYFAWVGKTFPYTPETFAESIFFEALRNRAFSYLRENGLAYDCQLFSGSPADIGIYRTQAVRLNLKSDEIEAKVKLIRTGLHDLVLPSFTPDSLGEILNRSRTRTYATPIPVGRRLRDVVTGLEHYDGRIIDSERVDHIWDQLSLQQMNRAYERIAQTPPITVIFG